MALGLSLVPPSYSCHASPGGGGGGGGGGAAAAAAAAFLACPARRSICYGGNHITLRCNATSSHPPTSAASVLPNQKPLGLEADATSSQKDSDQNLQPPDLDAFSAEWWEQRTGERPQHPKKSEASSNSTSLSGENDQTSDAFGSRRRKAEPKRWTWSRGSEHIEELTRRIKFAKDGQDMVANVLQSWKNPLTARNIVAIINNLDNWRKAYAFFEWAKGEDRFEMNNYVYNVMLKSLRRGKQWQLCEKIADQMASDGLMMDNITYSTLISCAKQCNLTEMALKWFDKMNSAGCIPDEVTYSSMIDVYGAAGRMDEAVELYERLRRTGWYPDEVTFGTVANVYAKVGNYKAIERLFADMKQLGTRPNAVLYNSYIQSLSKAGKPSLALNALHQMEESGIKPTTVSLSILIEMYSKLGAVNDAFAIFKQMQQEGLVCDRIVYNSLISACAENSLVKEAESVLVEMEEAGLTPDEATYRCTISVYASKGLIDKAGELLDRLLREGYKPSIQVYSSLVRACKQAQQFEKVPVYFEEMISKGCRPDQRFCGILMACLSTCKDTAVQERILDCLEWSSLTMHAIAKRLLAKDTDGQWLERQIKMALDEMLEDSHKPFCNTLIDMCVNLGYVRESHQILGIGVLLGVYENIQVRSDFEWRLNLRGLSLSAAQCAVEGWVSSLTLALEEGQQMPGQFIVETGGGRKRAADQTKLSETIPSLLKKLEAPFEEDLEEAGAFVATSSSVKSWLESRKASHEMDL